MKHNDDIQRKISVFSSRGLKIVGALPLAAFLILMLVLNAQKSSAVFESPALLAFLNTVFLCAVPLGIAYLAAKSHSATGIFAFLVVGCGLVFFGVGSLYAGWVMPLAGGPNPTVTLHNLGSLFAGICQLLGVHFFLQEVVGVSRVKSRSQRYEIFYVGIFILISITAVLAFRGNLPVFFDPLTGPSPLRQLVLGGAICLFAVAGLGFVQVYALIKTEFAYWYGLALWLITLGLTCVLLQTSVGSMIGWAGRGAQYLGCVYFIFAFLQGRYELSATDSSSATKPHFALWPYLEQRVRERTDALRESEEKHRLLFESAGDAILIHDKQGRMLIVNPAACERFGYTHAELMSMTVEQVDAPEQAQYAPERIERLIKQGRHSFETVHQRKDGSRIPTEVSARLITWEGQPAMMSTCRDITERKLAEEALRKNAIHYRTLLDNLPHLVWQRDRDSVFVDGNAACAQIFGTTVAELPGKTDYDFYPVELAEKYRADDRRIIENGASETFEERFLTKGVERFAQTTKVPLRDDQGRIYGTLGIAEDITERKQAEEALHKSEETHKNMIANISDVIGIIGVDGIMKYKSPNIEKWFGWQPQDLIGTDGWLAVHPDDLKRIQKEFLTLLEKDNSTTTLKYRYKCKEGSYKWIELTAVNLIHDPMINGVLMNYHDITDRKQVEEALRESDARLELFFTQSLDGFFFMMLDKPIQWDDSIDKDQALDYAFAHQRITKVNDALLAQYGATREQYLGLTPNTLFAHDIEYGKRVWSKFFDEGHLHIDTDERKLDDTPIWIEGDYICLYDSEGRITGHFGIQRDISNANRQRMNCATPRKCSQR